MHCYCCWSYLTIFWLKNYRFCPVEGCRQKNHLLDSSATNFGGTDVYFAFSPLIKKHHFSGTTTFYNTLSFPCSECCLPVRSRASCSFPRRGRKSPPWTGSGAWSAKSLSLWAMSLQLTTLTGQTWDGPRVQAPWVGWSITYPGGKYQDRSNIDSGFSRLIRCMWFHILRHSQVLVTPNVVA